MYILEKLDGSFELCEGTLNPEALGNDVVAGYTVAQKFARAMTFKAEDMQPKKERKFRCADGQLRYKHEMTEEDKKFLSDKMAKARAARKAA